MSRASAHYLLLNPTSTVPFGSQGNAQEFDTLGLKITQGSNLLLFNRGLSGMYLLNYTVTGSTVGLVDPTLNYYGCTPLDMFNGNTVSIVSNGGTTGSTYILNACVTINDPLSQAGISFVSGTYPAGSSYDGDLVVTQLITP